LVLFLMNTLPSEIRSHHFLSPAILTSVNSAVTVSVLTLVLKQPVQSLPLLSTQNLASTLCPQKTCDYIFYNIFNNNCPITIIFGTVSSKSMCHRKMVSFPPHLSSATTLPWEITEHKKMTNFALNNILFCE